MPVQQIFDELRSRRTDECDTVVSWRSCFTRARRQRSKLIFVECGRKCVECSETPLSGQRLGVLRGLACGVKAASAVALYCMLGPFIADTPVAKL